MRILYYLAAFGGDTDNIKYNILQYNLEYIYKNIECKFSIIINFYDNNNKNVKEKIRKLEFLEHIYFYDKIGVLTELFLTCPYNNIIKLYDYVLFILDDVKIINLDIYELIKIKKTYDIIILSPKVINSSHAFMNNEDENLLTINNILEIYCILLTPHEFKTFCNIHTIQNKWMWGVDHLFGYYKISAGIIYKYCVSHELPSKSNQNEALKLCKKYLKKYTKFLTLNDICKKYKIVKRKIIMS